MAVTLREKKLTDGQVSLYLDIYHNQKRWYEFLNIKVNKKRPTKEDGEKRKLALEIKAKREHELIVADYALVDKKGKKADFVNYFQDHIGKKRANSLYRSTLYQLKLFVGNKHLPIASLSTQWMKDFEHHLLKSVSNNTALNYLKAINAALNELVRKQILPCNPWHGVPKQDRLSIKEVSRTAWTMEQLQKLAETPCEMKLQYRQAYFFSCFTGLRWSDVNKIRWQNVICRTIEGKEEWFINFEQQKTRALEYFPVSDQAIAILKERQAEQKDSPYVFPQIKEEGTTGVRVYSNVNYWLKKWAKAAGLNENKMKFHTGRHTYATNLLEATNGDIYTVSKLLGHRSVLTTQIYAHVRDKQKYEAVKALPKLNLPQTVEPKLT